MRCSSSCALIRSESCTGLMLSFTDGHAPDPHHGQRLTSLLLELCCLVDRSLQITGASIGDRHVDLPRFTCPNTVVDMFTGSSCSQAPCSRWYR
mmetsp:Transcript_148700/g.476211  ORF Transcript_148700/g.476211 Transcript_148700/m.476211 type:complete len:94 (+) Transcript_148700:176-457(+)